MFQELVRGVGMELLLQAAKEKKLEQASNGGDTFFRDCIQGAIIMHPACFESSVNVRLALSDDLPVLGVWAKDDPLVPFKYSERLLVHDEVQLVAYDYGGHGSFDGSNESDPNFDDEIVRWIKTKFI